MPDRAKAFARKVMPRHLYEGVKEVVMPQRIPETERRLDQTGLVLTRVRYDDSIVRAPDFTPGLEEVELRVFSQNGEDGVLLHLMSQQHELARVIVEIGAGDGIECNSANLVVNWGWSGLLIDGNPDEVATARAFYASKLGARASRVTNLCAFVTTDNVNDLVHDNPPTAGGGQADIVSIDIDGNDYWIFEKLELRPKVFVIEYNASFGSTASVTIPYAADFARFDADASGFYHGASLVALTKLAASRGYQLVGCDTQGVNAFFVRDENLPKTVAPVAPEQAWRPHAVRCRFSSHESQQAALARMGPVVEV